MDEIQKSGKKMRTPIYRSIIIWVIGLMFFLVLAFIANKNGSESIVILCYAGAVLTGTGMTISILYRIWGLDKVEDEENKEDEDNKKRQP